MDELSFIIHYVIQDIWCHFEGEDDGHFFPIGFAVSSQKNTLITSAIVIILSALNRKLVDLMKKQQFGLI